MSHDCHLLTSMLVSGTDARGAAPTFHCCFLPHTDTHHPSAPLHSTPHTFSHLWGTHRTVHTLKQTVAALRTKGSGHTLRKHIQVHPSGHQHGTLHMHMGVRPYRQHRRSDPALSLTFPDVPPFPLGCTWSSRDALTTSSSLKHATVNSFDMAAHRRTLKQVTKHVDCYDTSLVYKSAECATLVARISTIIDVTIATYACGVFTSCAARHFEQGCGRVTKMAYYGQQGYGNPNPGYGQPPPPQAPQQDFLWGVFQK